MPDPFVARPDDRNPASLERERIEREEDNKDGYEIKMFDLFAEAVEDLYTGIIDAYVRKTPALWEEFVMKLEDGNWYLVDPDPSVGVPTEPNARNLCLDIHNNLRFSPRLCLWAVERKLKETYEKPPPGSFAEFALNQLRQYIEGRSKIDDDYYKHLVVNTQSRTFEDANYVNSIGSKVDIRPLAETFEIFAKKDIQLQRTVVWQDPTSASQDAMDTGDLPPGEIPESNEEAEAVDLPSGEMTVEAEADVPEDLPSGKRSRTEAKEEEVEMNEGKSLYQQQRYTQKKSEDCAWTPVVDEELLKFLESVEHKAGWIPYQNGHAQVSYRAKALRTPDPYYTSKQYFFRTSIVKRKRVWWLLEMNADIRKKNLHKMIPMHNLHLKKKHLTLEEMLKLMTMFLRQTPRRCSVQTVF